MNKTILLIFICFFSANISFSQSVTWFGGFSLKSDTKLDEGGTGLNFGGGIKTQKDFSNFISLGLQYSFDYYIGDRNNEENFVNTSIPHSDYTESIQNNFDVNIYGVFHFNLILRISLYGGGGINFLDGLKVQRSNVTGLDWNGGHTFKALPTFISGLQIYPFEKAIFLSFEFNKDQYNDTYLFRIGFRSSSQ